MNSQHFTLTHIISDYKKILRRHLSRDQSAQKMIDLAIKRKHISLASHADLLARVRYIREDLKHFIHARSSNPTHYCGLRRFLKHIEATLSQHSINEQNALVHREKKANKALVDVIQLIEVNHVAPHLHQIQDGIHTAVKYGNREQKKLLIKALKQQTHDKNQAISPLVHLLESLETKPAQKAS